MYMQRSPRSWILMLWMCCMLGNRVSCAQNLPWPMQQPQAAAAYDAIESELQAARYQAAKGHLQQGIRTFAQPSSDQLLFLMTYAQVLTVTAQFHDAIACLKFCQENYRQELDRIPNARPFLMECYADIAIEIQLTNPRRKAVRRLEKAYGLLSSDAPHKSSVARKIAVLHRITKNSSEAHKWYPIAMENLNGSCIDQLRLLNEEVMQAKKDCDLKACLGKVQLGQDIVKHCKGLRCEDLISSEVISIEYYESLSESAENPWELLQNIRQAANKILAISNDHPEIISQHLVSGILTCAENASAAGEMEAAREFSQRALDLQLKRGVGPKVASIAYQALGSACQFLGRKDEALQYYRLALLQYPHHLPLENDASQYINIMANYGQELIENEHFAEGEKYMQQAITALLDLNPNDSKRLSILYLNLAVGYDNQNLTQKAAEYFTLSAETSTHSPQGSGSAAAQARIGAATQRLELQDLSAAHAQLELGIEAIRQIPATARLNKVYPLLDLANYYRLLGDLEAALKANHDLLQVVLFDFKSEDQYLCPDLENYITPWYTLEAVDQKMSILWQMYQRNHDQTLLPAIVVCGQKALSLLRKLRQERTSEDDKLKVNQKWRQLYEKSLQADMELYRKTQDPAHLQTAFAIAEQSKAMMLMEAIVENSVLENTSATADMAQQRRNLRGQINLLRAQIGNGNANTTELKQQQEALLTLQKQLDHLLQQVEAANPKYFELVYQFDIVKLTTLQKILGREQRALVEFFYGDSAIYTLVVNADTLVVLQYLPDQAFQDSLAAFAHDLQARPNVGNAAAATAYLRKSKIITDALWRPIERHLRPRVVIIPDGPLSYISFEALVDRATDKQHLKFQDFEFLLDRYTISYHYSATFFSAPEAAKPPLRRGILALAPTFEGHPRLSPLPGSAAGVEDIDDQFENVDVLTQEAATKSAFLKIAPQYEILDLATHGEFDKQNFLDSRIYFSADGTGDSLLYLRDLYNLNLPAELAILEACETGLGDYHQGEGVMSLARGFTYAGCESVLMSLWQVPDGNSTHSIIQGFYDNLSLAIPRDEAIAKSKRSYLHALRTEGGYDVGQIHPYYWSELVLIGQQGPIAIKRRQSNRALRWIGFGLPAGLLLLGLMLYRRRQRNARS
jgi:CHAT domain-containing protein/tetratricopeptide (TPR) repeat protein